jgi:small subunit ribosomal protein S3
LGQKVHPIGFRLGVVKGHQSRWFAERDYKDILAEDFEIRKIINRELSNAAVSRIEIERTAADQVTIVIHTAKPGIVIGRSGEKVDRLRALLETKTRMRRVRVNIEEIRQPELDATLVSRGIAEQLEKRVSFRRAMKQAVQRTIRANAKGIKVIVGGRLGGAEIARSEKEVEGKVPLHTLRADIDYGQAEAHTTFGVIGVKVWIYRGDILPSKRRESLIGQVEAIAQPTFAPREGAERRERRGGGERRERRGGDREHRAPRGQRPQGERGPRPQGERGPRQPRGERPQGERGPRQPRGERPPRPQSEHAPRPEQAPAVESTAENTPPPAPPTDAGTTQSE